MESQARRRHDVRRHGEAVLRNVQPQRLANRRVRRRPRGERGRRVPRASSIATSRASIRAPSGSTAFPTAARLRKVQCDEPRTLVAELPGDAFVVCMTMGHATDRPILRRSSARAATFPFLGRDRQQGKAGGACQGTDGSRHPERDRWRIPLPDRPRHRHQSAGRDRDQRRGAADSGARPLAKRRENVILSVAKDLWGRVAHSSLRQNDVNRRSLTQSPALRSSNDTRAVGSGWRSRTHRQRTSACWHRIPASGRAGTSIS